VFQRGLTVSLIPRSVAAVAKAPDNATPFERAYDSEFPRVYGYIRYHVGNSDTADDLTSQTFLKALDRFAAFNPMKAGITPWILTIARNVVLDHLRAQRRWRWLPLDWLRERAALDPTPEQGAIQLETQRRLLGAVRLLSNRERDVLGLKFAGGLKNREIARLTGLRERHVGVLAYRAIGKLRKRLCTGEVRHA
jgi:RNA polymerase sigma factor (sigma-70 family)